MSNQTLPPVTLKQLEQMDNIKNTAIEADKAILPHNKAKLAKKALEDLFDLTQELIIQNGQLMLCTGMAAAPEV